MNQQTDPSEVVDILNVHDDPEQMKHRGVWASVPLKFGIPDTNAKWASSFNPETAFSRMKANIRNPNYPGTIIYSDWVRIKTESDDADTEFNIRKMMADPEMEETLKTEGVAGFGSNERALQYLAWKRIEPYYNAWLSFGDGTHKYAPANLTLLECQQDVEWWQRNYRVGEDNLYQQTLDETGEPLLSDGVIAQLGMSRVAGIGIHYINQLAGLNWQINLQNKQHQSAIWIPGETVDGKNPLGEICYWCCKYYKDRHSAKIPVSENDVTTSKSPQQLQKENLALRQRLAVLSKGKETQVTVPATKPTQPPADNKPQQTQQQNTPKK